jgi:hypothetical protein
MIADAFSSYVCNKDLAGRRRDAQRCRGRSGNSSVYHILERRKRRQLRLSSHGILGDDWNSGFHDSISGLLDDSAHTRSVRDCLNFGVQTVVRGGKRRRRRRFSCRFHVHSSVGQLWHLLLISCALGYYGVVVSRQYPCRVAWSVEPLHTHTHTQNPTNSIFLSQFQYPITAPTKAPSLRDQREEEVCVIPSLASESHKYPHNTKNH